MERTKIRWIVLPAIVVAALTLTSCATTDAPTEPGEQDQVTIRVPLTKDASALDVLVGVDQGFFEERGLDVQVEFVNDSSNLPQVTGRQYDVSSVSAVTMINSVASGIPLVAISGNRVDTPDNPTAGIVVPADSDIASAADLEGKSVGTPSVAGTLALATQYAIAQAGGDFSAMRLVQAPAPELADLLAANRFDAVLALEPARSVLVSKGFTDIGDPFRSLGDSVASAVYMATPDWIEANPDAVTAWIDALAEADQYIVDNPDESKALLVSEAGLAEDSVAGITLSTYIAELPEGTMQKWVDVMTELGTLSGDVDVDALTVG